jgi:hypothetical protein
MNKNYYPLLLLLLIINSIKLLAQPNLTAIGSNPNIGYSSYTVTNNEFTPGSAGSNQMWDLSSVGNTSVLNNSYTDINSTPYASQFPSANLSSNNSENYHFYKTTTAALTVIGSVSLPNGIVFNYSDGIDILRYPFTFGDDYTDQIAATYSNGTLLYRYGSISVTGDGWGILILPGATHMNVLRIHKVESFRDSSAIGITDYEIDGYYWYKEGVKEPLAYTSKFSVTINGTTVTSNFGGYSLSSVGLEESILNSNFILTPNPVNDELNIQLKSTSFDNLNCKIINSVGKEMQDIMPMNHIISNSTKIDVSGLKNGVYILQIIDSSSLLESKKFLVFH